MASDGGRVARLVEQFKQLPEGERKAMIDTLSSEDREAVQELLAREMPEAAVVKNLWDALLAGREMAPGDDRLFDAERQMAERMTDTFRRVTSMLEDRMKGRAYTDAELQSAIRELIAEDPEFRELAESMATLFRTYEGGST